MSNAASRHVRIRTAQQHLHQAQAVLSGLFCIRVSRRIGVLSRSDVLARLQYFFKDMSDVGAIAVATFSKASVHFLFVK